MTESCRLITTEQYQEYLKLKEEHKPISWEELKEEAKKMGYMLFESKEHTWSDHIYLDSGIRLTIDGTVMYNGSIVALDRTPDQMLSIMKALQ